MENLSEGAIMRDSEELLQAIFGVLVDAGIDTDAVCERICCSVEHEAEPERRSPHELQISFWTAVEEWSGADCIGLHLCPYLRRYNNTMDDYMLIRARHFM